MSDKAYMPILTASKIMQTARIGVVWSKTFLRPLASIIVVAITVPRRRTKLKGSERMTAAVSGDISLDEKPAFSISVGPYCTAITIPLIC